MTRLSTEELTAILREALGWVDELHAKPHGYGADEAVFFDDEIAEAARVLIEQAEEARHRTSPAGGRLSIEDVEAASLLIMPPAEVVADLVAEVRASWADAEAFADMLAAERGPAAQCIEDLDAARRALRDLLYALGPVRFPQDHSEFTAEDRRTYANAVAAARAVLSENPKETS